MSDLPSIAVHLHVIDDESRRLPLTVPAYLPVRDLTTRLARDAGLEAYWPDGRRRHFALRARGRVLLPDETLRDLGVVQQEVLHLLPEPRAGAGIHEVPWAPTAHEDPPDRRRWASVAASVLGLAGLAAGHALAVSVSQSVLTQGLGALGVGLLATGLARRLTGPPGAARRVLGLASAIALPVAGLAALGSLAADLDWGLRTLGWIAALLGTLLGLLVGWLAWHEAVEPLPTRESPPR
ncbi:MAG: EsaB/YukD family protein [Myxococcota bacterium]